MITPAMIAKSDTEAAHQSAVFCWAACAELRGFEAAREFCKTGKYSEVDLKELFPGGSKGVHELRWMHSSLYGAMLGDTERSRAIHAAKAKAQGMRPGVADIFLPVKRGNYSGLYIEMKKPTMKPKKETSKGGMSDAQIEFRSFVLSQGFGHYTAYSWEDAVIVIEKYLNWKG